MQKTLIGLAVLLLLVVFWAWPVHQAEAALTVSIGDASAAEGGAGETSEAVFTITLSEAPGKFVQVWYKSRGGSATGGEDFSHVDGSVLFDSDDTAKDFFVLIYGDNEAEGDEDFFVTLTAAKDGTGKDIPISDGEGKGTIQDDDGGGTGDGGDGAKTAPRLLPLCSNTETDPKEFSDIAAECNADSSCKNREGELGKRAGEWASSHNCCFPDAPPGFKEGGRYMWGGCTTSNFFEFLRNIIRFLALYLATTLAAVFIAYGGFVILISGGNASRYAEGKKAITIALVGLVIALGSFLIINTIFNVLTGEEFRTLPE